MFQKILIANRGEIAVRILRTCQELGIATVAVYSEADTHALHVRLADEAVLIGPPSPTASYLRGDLILDAAQQLGCDAIHPGYGFLAENADFAQAVGEAGLCFIGPGAEAIRMMGSKTAARTAMAAAGVPIIPGYQTSGADTELVAAADRLGFPLLVKASAGGGGKGMRLVHHPTELAAALQAARREAQNAFGDDQIYLEKVIEQARHIEFQIVGDQAGNLVHLFERDCSVQRRRQKIVEETPASDLSVTLRQRMGAAALAAARAVNYVNAGTVEFLVDGQENFYFLEMNTRLQVEHPITELVTGIDLVKLQLRMAAGEPLPFRQAELTQRGHAIECRIYAEDAANDFLPSTGTLLQVVEPVGPGVRVDSGVAIGDAITVHYDPLLAKLIVLGEDRPAALAKMAWALRHYVILGDLTTNVTFLQDLLNHPLFCQGAVTNRFVEQAFAQWQPAAMPPDDPAWITAALAHVLQEANKTATSPASPKTGDPYNPWRSTHGFRLGER